MRALATISWDPQIRGFLILAIGFLILCGSVFLLLSTNLGARLGLLLAVAGLTGWCFVLGTIWTVRPSTTGPQGRVPVWKAQASITGDLGPTAPGNLATFPRGWNKLPEGNPQSAEVQTSVAEFLAPAGAGAGLGFQTSADYVITAAYDRGGARKGPFGILNFRPFNVFHDSHYAAVIVHPAKKVTVVEGQKPPTPTVDPNKPSITVALVRDLGSRRVPVACFAAASGMLFGLSLYALHRRDRTAMARRAALPAGAT